MELLSPLKSKNNIEEEEIKQNNNGTIQRLSLLPKVSLSISQQTALEEDSLFSELRSKIENGFFQELSDCYKIRKAMQEQLGKYQNNYGFLVIRDAYGYDGFCYSSLKLNSKNRFIEISQKGIIYIVFETFEEPQFVVGDKKTNLNLTNTQTKVFCKEYVKFLGREPKDGYTSKQILEAVKQLFIKKKNVNPRLIVVKDTMEGDEYWGYDCPKQLHYHEWKIFKNNEKKCIAVCV